MTEFTLDVHPNKCQLFKAWYLFFFFFLNYRRFVHHQIQNKNWLQKQLNTLFRSCLAFRSCQSPYQQLCMSFHSSFVWQAALSSEVQNQSFKEVSAMFFFVFFFFILLSLLFSRLQEILVDFWFAGQPEKKVLVTVLCPQEVLKHQLASCAKTTKALWNTDSFISNPEEVKTWIFKDLCVQLLQFYNFTGWIFFSSSVLHHKTQSVASRAQVADICDANNCIYKTVYLVTP